MDDRVGQFLSQVSEEKTLHTTRKYGNDRPRLSHQFYGIGNMPLIFGSGQTLDNTFELVSLDGEKVPLEQRGKSVSLILSGGRSNGIYSIFMIRGLEAEGFLLGNLQMRYLTYVELMKDVDESKSRRFSRCRACCEGFVIFEMEDQALYLFDLTEETFSPFLRDQKEKVKLIAHSMMSSSIVVYFSNHTLRMMKLDEKKLGREIKLANNSPIKIMAKYVADLIIFVHQDNSMYIYRDDEETDGFSDIPDNITTRIDTDMFTSPIKQIACGYSHLVVLLANGRCYTRGMNNYGQCNGKNSGEGSTITYFFPLLHNTDASVLSVNCSSLSTTLELENEIIIIGEVSQTFEKLNHPLCNGMSSFWVHKKEFPDEATSFGPWHGFIYRASFLAKPWKTLQYYMNNMRTFVSSSRFGDISIIS